jgi:hypothetical protein
LSSPVNRSNVSLIEPVLPLSARPMLASKDFASRMDYGGNKAATGVDLVKRRAEFLGGLPPSKKARAESGVD